MQKATTALRLKQRNAVDVRRLRNRLQVRVDVREIGVGKNLLAVSRHGAVRGAHEGGKCFPRQWIGREALAAAGHDRSLAHGTVALPAAVLNKGSLAVLCGSGRSG